MLETHLQLIDLGPGGVVLDVEANKELLEKIRRTQPLPPSDLLNLSDYFRSYMTDVPLGDHIELVALRQMIFTPNVREALVAAGYPVLSTPELNLPEWLEDSQVPVLGDNGGDECSEPVTQGNSKFLQVEWVAVSGVGLLIEVVYYKAKDDSAKKRYYVIGVSPDPHSLRPDAQGRVRRVRSV